MIEIEEPPNIRACAPCARPLVWLWSPRTQRWVPFATEPSDTSLLRVHSCPRFDRPVSSWRQLEQQDPQTARAGAARVRQALASKETNP